MVGAIIQALLECWRAWGGGAEFYGRVWGSPLLICGEDKRAIFFPVLLVRFPWKHLNPALCCPGMIGTFYFSRLKTHCDNLFRFLSVRSEQIISILCPLRVLFLYSPKKALSFPSKVTIFLHFLWAGPLQAIVVTALLWMEIGISCLAGMAVLIILLPLQSCIGKLFSSLR